MNTTQRLPTSLRLRALLVVLSALALVGGAPAAQAQVVIDEFTTTQTEIIAPPGGSSNAVTAGSDIVGQNRNLTVLLVEGAGDVSAEVVGGALEVAMDDTTPNTRGDVVLVWDGGDETTFDPTGLMSVDLTDGGTTGGLRFDIEEAPAGVSLVVTVYTDGSNVSRAGRVLPAIAAPASLYIDWSELVTAPDAVGPADLTNVGAITLQLSGTEILRLAVTHIAAVAPQVAASKVDRTAAGAAIPPAGVNPGDQVRYRVTVTNPGAGAEGVDFDDTVDANTAIVGGSVRTTPLARRDHYATVTGVVFDSVLESAPTLLTNDLDPDGDSLAAVVATGQATTQGGTVDIEAGGDFVYTPPTGFQGVDSFTYELDATAGDPTVDAAGNAIAAITGRAYVIIDRVAPELADAGTVVFTEDLGPVAIAPALLVTDDDSPNLASATVTITNVLDGADEMLAAPSCGGFTVGGSGTSSLTISGSGTLAAYQTCLRSVTYENDDQDPNGSDRMVEFQVSDGLLLSNIETATVEVVPVNDAPVVTTSGGTSDFIEDTSGPVVVDNLLTVTDVDDTNIESAMVSITNVLDGALESLTANAGSCGALMLTNNGTATVTISGTATEAAYQTCLRSVAYDNTDQDPNATDRSISFKVNDGDVDSALAFKTVTVTPMNDPIVFTTNPIAYTTPGNTQLHVAGRTTPGVAAYTDAQNVLAKSGPADVDGPMAATVVPFAGATPNGMIDIIATGAFFYVPNVGFTGIDTFNVQVTDGADAVNLTINMTVAETVWYVCDETGADACVTGGVNVAGGDGRSTNAFETVTAAAAASVTVGDFIFVFEGNTVASPLTGGIALEDGEKLHGQGIGLTVPGFGQLVAPGPTRPRIRTTVASTDVVSVPATATKRENVEIRGLDLEATGTTSNAIDVTSSGALNLIVRISDNTIRGAIAEGIDVNGGSTSTTQRLAIHDNNLTAGGTALDVTRTAGTVTITAFDDNVVTGNSNGAGIVVTGPVTFDATPGGALDAVSGGNTAIGANGNPITGAGLTLSNVTGALDFTDLDIYAGTSALTVTGTGAFTGAAGTRITVTAASPDGIGTATFDADNGAAVDITMATIDLRLADLDSNTAASGVALSGISGPFRAPAGSSISKTSGGGTAFSVASSVSSSTVTYAGTLNVTSGAGVSLTSNTGSTIAFSGGMTLSTGTNAGFSATGGGTVTVTDPVGPTNNTITTTTGQALTVTGTTIGANGLTFESISAGTAASGPSRGIELNNTGTSGGLTITGGASAGAGGTIQRCAIGISLTSTRGVVLNDVNMSNFTDWAIRGASVVNFIADNLQITGTNGDNDATNDGSVYFTELTGSAAISNSSISGGHEDNVVVLNTTGTLNRITISNTVIGANGTNFGDNGILFEASGTATLNATVTGGTFTSTRGDHVQFSATSGSPVGDFVLTGNTFSNNHPNTVSGAGGIRVTTGAAASSPSVTYNISNNTINGARGTAIGATEGAGAGTVVGTLSGNNIGTAGVADSGSLEGSGISIVMAELGSHTATITNNDIRQYNNNGIIAQAGGGASASSGNLKAVVTGNTISNPGSTAYAPGKNGFHLNGGTFPGDTFTVCVDLGGAGALENSMVGSGDGVGNGTDFRFRQRQNTTVYLPGYAGANNNDAAVITYVQNRNAGTPTGTVTNTVGSGGGGYLGNCPF